MILKKQEPRTAAVGRTSAWQSLAATLLFLCACQQATEPVRAPVIYRATAPGLDNPSFALQGDSILWFYGVNIVDGNCIVERQYPVTRHFPGCIAGWIDTVQTLYDTSYLVQGTGDTVEWHQWGINQMAFVPQ